MGEPSALPRGDGRPAAAPRDRTRQRPAGARFWRASWLIAAKDLRIEWRTLEALSAMLLFSLIVLVVFSFAFGATAVDELGAARWIPGVLWTVLSFSAIVGFARSFQHELRNDTLSALRLAPIDPGSVFVGKLLANLTKVVLLELLILPLAAMFFDFELFTAMPLLAGVLLLHTVGLAELGTLTAAIAARVGRGEALVATLLFPVASPLLISAVKCTRAALAGDPLSSISHWLWMSAGFTVLFFLVALLTVDYVLEE